METELAAHLEVFNRQLAELLDKLRESELAVADVYRVTWAAGETADQSFRGRRAGFAIFNETAADLFVGLSAGTGDAGACRFTVAAKHFLVLPFPTALVSVGAAAIGTATLVALAHPEPFAGGAY